MDPESRARREAKMTQNEVKPGTRCECANPDCPGSLRQRGDGPNECCRDTEATNVVTLPTPTGTHQVMMCAPCAAFHESKAAPECSICRQRHGLEVIHPCE